MGEILVLVSSRRMPPEFREYLNQSYCTVFDTNSNHV